MEEAVHRLLRIGTLTRGSRIFLPTDSEFKSCEEGGRR